MPTCHQGSTLEFIYARNFWQGIPQFNKKVSCPLKESRSIFFNVIKKKINGRYRKWLLLHLRIIIKAELIVQILMACIILNLITIVIIVIISSSSTVTHMFYSKTSFLPVTE